DSFLNEVAGYARDRIGKVVLNSEYEVGSVQRTLSNCVINIEYMVPKGAVENINIIEVKSKEDHFISRNEVFIPIASDTIIRQAIFIEEV
ncbi:ketopantoate hydroxymethyltransferase, partial [Paenibacillus larvae]